MRFLTGTSIVKAQREGSMDPAKIRKFAIYTIVNIAAGVVDFTSFMILTHLYGAPTIQSIFAYMASLLTNYTLQRRFVFVGNVSGKSEARVFFEFAGTGMFGLASTALVIWLCIDVMDLSAVFAKTLAMVVCFFVLYVVRNHFVFNDQTSDAQPAPRNGPGFWEQVPVAISAYGASLLANPLALDDAASDAVGFFILFFATLVSFRAY